MYREKIKKREKDEVSYMFCNESSSPCLQCFSNPDKHFIAFKIMQKNTLNLEFISQNKQYTAS